MTNSPFSFTSNVMLSYINMTVSSLHTLPKEMLTEDKGSVHIQIEHISDEDMDTFEYGCSSAAFFYLKKDDNIIFSTKEFK